MNVGEPGPRRALGPRTRGGLVLAALLAASDLAVLLLLEQPEDPRGEPATAVDPVVVLTVLLAFATLAACVAAWTTGTRPPLRVAAVTRLFVAALNVPAFFYPGVPAGYVVGAAVALVLTAVDVALLLSRR